METQFCAYTLVSEISRGASSVVYLARDRRGAKVALKTLAVHLLNDPAARKAFMVEPQRQPRGPHIVRMLDSGECNGVPYMAMELIDGPSLNDLIMRANRAGMPLPFGDVDMFLADIAEALDAAHTSNVVHRDIKPSNILIRESDGHAFLMDFGIAQSRLNVNPGATVARVSVGTSNYIAPEQITDSAVGPAADIYSLGVTVYQALAGRLPFTAEDEIVQMHQHLNEPPPVLHAIAPRIPQELSDVVMRALEKVPGRRYASAGEFARSFHHAVAAIPGAEPPTRRWLVFAVLGGIAALAVALLFAALSIANGPVIPSTPGAPSPASTSAPRPTVTIRSTKAVAATETTSDQAAVEPSSTDTPELATATLEPTDADSTSTPTPGSLSVERFSLLSPLLGVERWGKPTSADGCGSFDDQSPVTRYEVMLTISNTGTSTLSNWRVNLVNESGGNFSKCPVIGQEGAAIAAGASYDYKADAYSAGFMLSRVEFVKGNDVRKLCVNGKSLTPCK